jgi:hypothetical protein
MKLLFFDETSDDKFKEYLGVCCAAIDARNYPRVKSEFQAILKKYGWSTKNEFKGNVLFSASQGDKSVSVETRVQIAEDILNLNVAKKNARIQFHYFRKNSQSPKEDYLACIPEIIRKALPRTTAPKNLVSVHFDHRSDIDLADLRSAVIPAVEESGYILFEDIAMPTSRYETVGILYADLIGYLLSRIDTIRSDSELFDNVSREMWEKNGKIRKMLSSQKLIEKVKNLSLYVEKKK